MYDKLNKQLRKYKNRLQDRHQSNESIRFDSVDLDNENDFEDEDENLDIVIERNKKFDMKPMSPEEAVLQMELIGHEFYMFRNIDTDEISVVYKRENGGYGMIEHE